MTESPAQHTQSPPPQGTPLSQHIPPPQGAPHTPEQPAPPQGAPQTPVQQTPPPQGTPQTPLYAPPQEAPHQHQIPQQYQQGRLALNQRTHVHHSYIWMSIISSVIAVFAVLLFTTVPLLMEMSSIQRAEAGLPLSLGIAVLCLVILGAIILWTVLSYKHLFYELGSEEFNLYSGIISKKRVHVPYQRIQSVNQKAGLLQRIVGVCTVNIDTAGGASNKAIVVPYLLNSDAERLRTELFARKQAILAGGAAAQAAARQTASTSQAYTSGDVHAQRNVLDAPAAVMTDMRGVFGGEEVVTGVVTYQYGLSNKELILSGISNSTSFALLLASIVAAILSIGGMALGSASGRWAYEQGAGFVSGLVSSPVGIGLVIGIIVVALLVCWAFSILGTCITYGGFKASRRGSRIEVERGLLQRHFQGVDIDRVQSVTIKQSFIRKIFGYCELSLGKIDALTSDSSGQQQTVSLGLVVHPFVKLNRVPEILAGLTPEYADVPTETKPVAKRALRRAIIRRTLWQGGGFWLAVCTTVLLVFMTMVWPAVDGNVFVAETQITLGALCLYLLSIIIAVLDVIGAVLWYRGSSFAYNQSFMQVTNGGFSRVRVSFPRRKIQFGHTRSNPFQRISHVKTINARTAAGIGGTTVRLVDVHEQEADEWLDWVKPRSSSS